jgi:TRAP-type C4-dicarboxylate transport system substrate-binding protein
MQKAKTALLSVVVAFSLIILAGCSSAGSGSAAGTIPGSGVSSSTQSSSAGKVYTLTVLNHDPKDSICGQYVEAWGKIVEDASGGRLKFIYYHNGSLVSADESVNAVLSGKADICWSACVYFFRTIPHI